MTDIVERLRGGWNHDRNPEADMVEAADRIIELERELAAKIDRNGVLYIRLAEGQAREKMLRDALSYVAYDESGYCMNPDAAEVLEAPADDTALRDALKAERERIASLILDIDTGAMDAYQVSEAIRALED